MFCRLRSGGAEIRRQGTESALRGGLELCDVELPHGHHCGHHALGAFARPVADAGTEKHNELKSHIPGPCCGNPFVRDPEGALIAPHEGITGRGQLSPALYDWNGAAARITIERAS